MISGLVLAGGQVGRRLSGGGVPHLSAEANELLSGNRSASRLRHHVLLETIHTSGYTIIRNITDFMYNVYTKKI